MKDWRQAHDSVATHWVVEVDNVVDIALVHRQELGSVGRPRQSHLRLGGQTSRLSQRQRPRGTTILSAWGELVNLIALTHLTSRSNGEMFQNGSSRCRPSPTAIRPAMPGE